MASKDNGLRPTEDNLAVVHRFNDAFQRRDVDGIMALMTADCVFENTYPPPDGVRISGAAAVRAFWAEMFAAPSAAFTWEEVFACQGRTVVRWRYDWMDAAGKQGHIRGVDILRIRAGKIAEKLSYVKG